MKRFQIIGLNPENNRDSAKIEIDWFTGKSQRRIVDDNSQLSSEPQRYEFHFKFSFFGYGFLVFLGLHSTGDMIGYKG